MRALLVRFRLLIAAVLGTAALGGGMVLASQSTDYHVFVGQTPTPPATATATATATSTPDSDPFASLDRVAWEGGPAYWSVAQNGAKMTKADAAGWDEDTFFPIAVFLGKPDHADELAALGINVFMAAEHSPPISNITEDGVYVMPQYDDWTSAEIGSDPNVVGWFSLDECEQGEPPCTTGDENDHLTQFQAAVATIRAKDDGRFVWSNFGNGVLGTFWAPTTMSDFVDETDGMSVDKYAYTSPGVDFEIGRASDWTDLGGTEANSDSSAAYGWFLDQMRNQFGAASKPVWGFFETKMPFLGETDARIISYAQLEGAVWSAIAHESRGIAYFQHNGFYNGSAVDPNTGTNCEETYSLVDCEQGLKDAVTEINAEVTALAPVLNTQSYVWDFDAAGIDTMLKEHDGFAYIFASVGIAASTGSKTFTLPTGVTGTTVTVVDEDRTISVTDGEFTDSFDHEYTHHIYKVAL